MSKHDPFATIRAMTARQPITIESIQSFLDQEREGIKGVICCGCKHKYTLGEASYRRSNLLGDDTKVAHCPDCLKKTSMEEDKILR